MKQKRFTDQIAMVMALCAIITGFKLHREVHHLFLSDNNAGLWVAHIMVGLIVAVALIFHLMQHKLWFKDYKKIKPNRKIVTTILFIIAYLEILSGTILMFGGHSNFISIFHYITAIVFISLAIGHIVKRWKIFKVLFKCR